MKEHNKKKKSPFFFFFGAHKNKGGVIIFITFVIILYGGGRRQPPPPHFLRRVSKRKSVRVTAAPVSFFFCVSLIFWDHRGWDGDRDAGTCSLHELPHPLPSPRPHPEAGPQALHRGGRAGISWAVRFWGILGCLGLVSGSLIGSSLNFKGAV